MMPIPPHPPLDMLHLSGAPNQRQPRSPVCWSQTPCSPVTRGNLKKTIENVIINNRKSKITTICVLVCVSSLTDEGLSRTGLEESGRDKKEGPESSDWPR